MEKALCPVDRRKESIRTINTHRIKVKPGETAALSQCVLFRLGALRPSSLGRTSFPRPNPIGTFALPPSLPPSSLQVLHGIDG